MPKPHTLNRVSPRLPQTIFGLRADIEALRAEAEDNPSVARGLTIRKLVETRLKAIRRIVRMSNGTTTIEGQLEIDPARGVIYFHSAVTGTTVLRICNLPKPIPLGLMLDVTHMHGCGWSPVRPVVIHINKPNPLASLLRTGDPADANGDEYGEQ